MIGEISLYGMYVPWLLLLALLALAVSRALSALLARAGFYRLVWHPALFDLAMFIVVLGALSRFFPEGS
jgi:protein-S-isoprenylcysteine O-methyltransferase Ste14